MYQKGYEGIIRDPEEKYSEVNHRTWLNSVTLSFFNLRYIGGNLGYLGGNLGYLRGNLGYLGGNSVCLGGILGYLGGNLEYIRGNRVSRAGANNLKIP